MSRRESVEFVNMCLIKNGDKVLVQDRVSPNWPGITFPGGHVERGESFVDAVIREVKEETGLTISKPQLRGIKDWYDDEDYRYVVLFYKTEHFTGELQSSDEGKVWWEDFENLSHLKLATEDMSDMLRVFWKMISVNSFTIRMEKTGLTNSNNSKSAEVTPPIFILSKSVSSY